MILTANTMEVNGITWRFIKSFFASPYIQQAVTLGIDEKVLD